MNKWKQTTFKGAILNVEKDGANAVRNAGHLE